MMLSMPSGATSTTGARFMLMPTAASSVAVISAKRAASASSRMAGLPANWVNGGPSRATWPPSWSMAMNSGGRPLPRAHAWAARHSPAICSGEAMLRLNRMRPPTRRPAIRCSSAASMWVPSKPAIRRWPASCSSVHVLNSIACSLHEVRFYERRRGKADFRWQRRASTPPASNIRYFSKLPLLSVTGKKASGCGRDTPGG